MNEKNILQIPSLSVVTLDELVLLTSKLIAYYHVEYSVIKLGINKCKYLYYVLQNEVFFCNLVKNVLSNNCLKCKSSIKF